jgi:DNA-binding MarR family transcriptional regulator
MQRAEKKNRTPESPEEAVFVNIARTADALYREVEKMLKASSLSPAQYNVLRILRGAGAEGLACRQVAVRMVTRDPDMTRLLDRLEARGLVLRTREKTDRRVITTRITEEGLHLLRELDKPVQELHRRQLGHLGSNRLKMLAQLLDLVREGAGKRREQ